MRTRRMLRRTVSTLTLLVLLLPAGAWAGEGTTLSQLVVSLYAWFATPPGVARHELARSPESMRTRPARSAAGFCAQSGQGGSCTPIKVTCDNGAGIDPNGSCLH